MCLKFKIEKIFIILIGIAIALHCPLQMNAQNTSRLPCLMTLITIKRNGCDLVFIKPSRYGFPITEQSDSGETEKYFVGEPSYTGVQREYGI